MRKTRHDDRRQFGKTIQRAQSLSEPSWHPYWLDYKQLKKTLKTLELPMHNAKPVQAPQDAASSGAEDSPDELVRRVLNFFQRELGLVEP